MKVIVIAALSLVLFAGQAVAEEKKQMSEKEKLSYSLGFTEGGRVAGFLKSQDVGVETDTVIEGFKAGISGAKPVLAEQEIQQTIDGLQKSVAAKQAERFKEAAAKNKEAGAKFLAENAKKEGVVVLPSGLQYRIIKAGTGPMPKATNRVKVNYRGTLIDGTEFDSSYKRGEPAEFHVDKVIAGWTEALEHMETGSKWELFIPANLAYGERGAGPKIGPDAALVFEVELLSIEK